MLTIVLFTTIFVMAKKKKLPKVDDLDIAILSILLFDAKKPYAEVGKKLKVSGGTIHVRLRKLMESGIISGSNLEVNYRLLGYTIKAFLGVYLEKSSYYTAALEELRKIPEVVEAHYTSGSYSLFVKVICKDTEHLRKVVAEKISTVSGVTRTESFISMDEGIKRELLLEEVDA